MEFIRVINRSRIVVRHCNSTPAHRVAVISHGRFVPLRAVTSSIKIAASVPLGVRINWYVRHGETITNHQIMGLYERLHRNELPTPVKDYSTREIVKNYTLRPEDTLMKVCIPRHGGHCDAIFPLDIITIDDILAAVRNGQLAYREIHFLSCRAERLTSTAF